MRRPLILAALAILAAPMPADGARQRKPKLRGQAKAARAKAPPSWSATKPWATAAPPATPSVLPAANPRSVSVGSTEFAFTLSQPSVAAGDVRVEFDNSRAEDPHDLALEGNGERFDFEVLGPGEVDRRTFALTPGTYTLVCPLSDHEARGMSARLTVRPPDTG